MDNLSDFDKQLIEWCNDSRTEVDFFIDFEENAMSSLHVYFYGVQDAANLQRDLTSCF